MAEQILENLYMIDGFVREFFIIGEEYVLLIDTGFGKEDIQEMIKEYSNLPVKVVLTHGHRDHTGLANQFDEVYIDSKDAAMYDGSFRYA